MNIRAMILAGVLGLPLLAGAALAAGTGDLSLVTAAKQGDRDAVQSLLNGPAKKTSPAPKARPRWSGRPPAMTLEMVDLLLRAGADAKAANEFGATALYAAAAMRIRP